MKNKFLLVFYSFIILFSENVFSDPFGASNAALYKQMVVLVENTRQQLEEMRNNLSVAENMRDMQRSEFIQELTEVGDSFGKMFSDIRAMEREIADWKDDPYGTNQIEADIDRLRRLSQDASNQDSIAAGETYALMLQSLSRMRWLGEAQAQNEKKLSEGVSEKDSNKIQTGALVSMNRVLLDQEMSRKQREVISNEIFLNTLENVSYGGMGLMGGGN